MSVPDPIHLPRPGAVTAPAPTPDPRGLLEQMRTSPESWPNGPTDPKEEA